MEIKTAIAAGAVALIAMGALARAQGPAMPAMPTPEQTASLAAQGAKPGDDQMTCQQIGAEMQPYMAPMAPAAQAMGADAQQMQAYADRKRAEMTAQAPVNMAAAAAASLVPGGALIAEAQAQAQEAQARRDAAAVKPMQDKAMADTGAMAEQMAPLLQNPRLQRLMQLSQQKCQNVR